MIGVKSLTLKLTLIGCLAILFIGIFVAATFFFTETIDGEAARINEAGRLRYRAFDVVLALHDILEPTGVPREQVVRNIEVKRRIFAETLDNVLNGNPGLEIPPLSDEAHRHLLHDIGDNWRKDLDPLIDRTMTASPLAAGDLHGQFTGKTREYVRTVDRFVGDLEQANQAKIDAFDRFRLIAFSFFIVMVAAVTLSMRRSVVSPLRRLRNAITRVEAGDLETHVEITMAREKGDELARLSHAFNDMVDAVRAQREKAQSLLSNIDRKHLELTDSHRALQSSRDQLEVSYEEVQTQSEELESANEELRILNEDLDRKTRELLDVNRRLTVEEEKARRVMNELQTIFDAIQDAVAFYDLDFNVIKANRAFHERPRARTDHIHALSCRFTAGATSPDEGCIIAETYRTETPQFRERRTGHDRLLQAYTFPVRDQGRIVGVVEYIKDVTDRRTLEQQLLQAEKLSSLGEMLSGIAHEINNPLTVIIGFAELVAAKEVPEAVKNDLSKILKESLRCRKILDDLLRFARRHASERVSADANEIVRKTVELCGYDKTSKVAIVTDLASTVPVCRVTPDQIQQVLLNIVNNARQAILERKPHGAVTIRTLALDGKVRIEIGDDGPGIAPEHLHRIFDPFFTTKGVGKGTGLGLSISYAIVKEHGGTIDVRSRPGEGATFVIDLPTHEPS